ncbi:MAG: isoleucyl-tRNA synthetase, partial [Myxococcota bacterium]
MTFEAVAQKIDFPGAETRTLEFWRDNQIFQKSLDLRKGAPRYVFFEGPPTANGTPHNGHVLTRVIKDLFPRYKTMRGFEVPRKAGWDTHGLPVEVEVEKSLGIHGKAAIEKYGVEAFTRRCIDSVFTYTDVWRDLTDRIGFWVDLDNAYVTFHKSYVESVWWALSTLFNKGLLYQGHKVLWWWPQGGTALSSGEVGLGYKTVDDPSITVRFKIEDEDASFLAWTTTPWTLPSNCALTVNQKLDYVYARKADEVLVVAAALADAVLGEGEYTIEQTVKGAELLGKRYQPVFNYAVPEEGRAFEVIAGDFVTTSAGTGVVHTAPAFGEDDYRVAKANGIGMLQLVKPDGTFVPEVTDFAGRFCKEADRDIIRNLTARGLLYDETVYRHDYPYCWRADTDPLIQYARPAWFIRTTDVIDRVIENNQQINWLPDHIKDGRFGDFLANNVDWALSRERYWGTPLPIWTCPECEHRWAAPSTADIEARNPNAFDAFAAARVADPTLSEHLAVHKPWIDEVTVPCDQCSGTMVRVPEVIDCWFDSGCMPFAQWGYPHQNKEDFEASWPADFISEAIDQTRGWFYSLLMISTLLFDEKPADEGGEPGVVGEDRPHPYKTCVVLGHVCDMKGKKESKSKGNYTPPGAILDTSGADAMRWYF